MRIFLSLVVISVLCGSCDSERIFEDNVEFRDRNWKIAQSVQFEFQIADTSRRYNLWMNIRNSLDYPYARIFVNYDLQKDSATLNKKMIIVPGFLPQVMSSLLRILPRRLATAIYDKVGKK